MAAGTELAAQQLTNMRDALDALEAGNYPLGEDAIFDAEKGFKPRYGPVATDLSFAGLVERFERLRAEGE